MTPTRLEFVFAAAFSLGFTAHGATAAYLNSAAGAPKERAAESSLMQRTHGCHYSCECGPLKDFGCEQAYHRHLHMLCLPVRCRGQDCNPTPSEGVCRHIPPP
jgi:hypothetical protein